jgi:hypothetical protein
MKKHNLHCWAKAFSFPELLLAAAIFAFAFGALVLGFITCAFLNDSSRSLTQATIHAQYVMEEIKDTNFSEITSKINGDPPYWDWDSAEIANQGLLVLNGETIDTQVTGTDLLDIVVTVSWKDRKARDRDIALETLLAEP